MNLPRLCYLHCLNVSLHASCNQMSTLSDQKSPYIRPQLVFYSMLCKFSTSWFHFLLARLYLTLTFNVRLCQVIVLERVALHLIGGIVCHIKETHSFCSYSFYSVDYTCIFLANTNITRVKIDCISRQKMASRIHHRNRQEYLIIFILLVNNQLARTLCITPYVKPLFADCSFFISPSCVGEIPLAVKLHSPICPSEGEVGIEPKQ